MGETAENVAHEFGVGREAQDAFAAESQRRAGEATRACRFADEIVPVLVTRGKGEPVRVERDEHPRPETTVADLARLRPVFREGGTVTAGNSSGINDGAAALLVTSAERGRALGLHPMARFVAGGVAGVEPHRMGIGPVPASQRALARAGWSAGDLDLVEINEAFAAQALPCIDLLGLDPEKVNVNGGAIALGHPIGCSGARITVTLLHELRRRGAARALATMCIGVGQGISATFERVDA
jgi:acetyl-CoA acetyltransferase family protein